MLAPSVGPELVKFFPYLEDVRWTLVAIYGHIRDEFAEALLGDKILLRAKVHITESNITESDQLYGGHKVTSTGTTFDPFSASLRTFSYSRTSLILKPGPAQKLQKASPVQSKNKRALHDSNVGLSHALPHAITTALLRLLQTEGT